MASPRWNAAAFAAGAGNALETIGEDWMTSNESLDARLKQVDIKLASALRTLGHVPAYPRPAAVDEPEPTRALVQALRLARLSCGDANRQCLAESRHSNADAPNTLNVARHHLQRARNLAMTVSKPLERRPRR